MRLSPDYCVHCGSSTKPYSLSDSHNYYYLQPDGSIQFTRFWFCSIDCYKAEARKTLDRKYDYDATFDNSHEKAEVQKKYIYWKNKYENEESDTLSDYAKECALDVANRDLPQARKDWQYKKKEAIDAAEHRLESAIRETNDKLFDKEQREWRENSDREFDKKVGNLRKLIAEKQAYEDAASLEERNRKNIEERYWQQRDGEAEEREEQRLAEEERLKRS